jgi:hypothetical protein
MNELLTYFERNTGGLIHKWGHYFDIYDFHLSKMRGSAKTLLEFGVSHGGSLQMWKHYFGKDIKIYGVDINPHCKKLEENQVSIFICDQSDRGSLKQLAEKLPLIDILIDDGGHTMQHQINTFEIFFPRVAPEGIYICEDLHTSYRPKFGGGCRRKGTFIEYSKNLIDSLNAWHSRQPKKLAVSELTKTIQALHFYDSMLVIQKKQISPPFHKRTGVERVPSFKVSSKQSFAESITSWWLRKTSRLF